MFLQLIHARKAYEYDPIFKAYVTYTRDKGHK